jgi:hypothetical protein
VTVTVVHDQQVAEPAQPVGMDDPTGGDRAHFLADGAPDEPPFRAASGACRWGTEAPG